MKLLKCSGGLRTNTRLRYILSFLLGGLFLLSGTVSFASVGGAAEAVKLNLTTHWVGYTSIAIFVFAYILVMLEEVIHLRKSKPVIIAAGLIWALVGYVYSVEGGAAHTHTTEVAFRHFFLEFAELFLFLLVAMTYINAMTERGVFDALRAWMVNKGFTFKQLFWITGWMAFFLSPIIDNLTTALVMCAVVLAVGGTNKNFIVVACINIVVAANAGGAFSPFGDITTLMVWVSGKIPFAGFFALFIPSVVNYVIPALLMYRVLGDEKPEASEDKAILRDGAFGIIFLFAMTILTVVLLHNITHLPPVLGMMTGLGYLQFYGFYLRRFKNRGPETVTGHTAVGSPVAFDVFQKVARAEWDTLLFFYGVVLCVGGLGFIGYLSLLSTALYDNGATIANVILGIFSAVVDNIPVMVAVLQMSPEMTNAQWLLITLTTGVGGSMLSIGSAAGVALMGQARGIYTFGAHLKWTWAIALGYFASIAVHLSIQWLMGNPL